MSRPTDVLVIAGEPVWPPSHGGRLRAAGVVRALARQVEVRVAAPAEGEPSVDVALDPLPAEPPLGRASAALNPSPRLGRAALGPERARRVVDLVARHRPGIVLFARSYLAAVAPVLGVPTAVDFADVDVRRMASLARASGAPARARLAYGLEWFKARRWEPLVARRAVVCAAADEGDAHLLSSWGARAIFVPNGASPLEGEYSRSPAQGPVTFVATFGYQPNRDGARFLLERVWPRLHAAVPNLRMRLVGRDAARALAPWRNTPGVEVVSDPVSIEPFYRDASVVVAPVRSGGGAQLKVTEALARGRLVVATPFSALAAPPGAQPAVETADGPEQFATAVLRLWRDLDTRWDREADLVARRPVPSWEEACAPLVDALLHHLAHARGSTG